ncbi:glycosyltransferase family 4 protein [Pseudooceanicola onchidii]|uniref:glycosyltransferase family 4 protein n=1 Tax=Pseudooceanicola onchidii TaxID=2562279 RepID=UPI0010AADE00|nr:glycosyltransferase family 4 protein [Pseudooceanicola onchidii]
MRQTIWLVCQYASTPAVGGHLRQHYLARELAKQGHDVYVISVRKHHLMVKPEIAKAAPFKESVDGYTMVRVTTLDYPHAHHKKRILGWIQFGLKLPGLLRHGVPKPDVVLYSSPGLLGFLGAERVARRVKAKLVFEVRDIWPLSLVIIGNYEPSHPFIRLLQWVEDRAYRVSDQVISNLQNAVDHMASRGMDRGKFHWLPNGVLLGDRSMADPLAPSVNDQLPTGKFIVGYAGTLGEANNLDVFLAAAAQLRTRTDIEFVLVGDGRNKDELKAYAQREQLDNVTFIDAIPKTQVQSLLSHFDACYIGLPAEPLFKFGVSPNKLFDYLAAAKPIIYAVDSGPYNPVSAHHAGVAIAPGDPEAIVAAVNKLAALSDEDRCRMGQNGRNAVETEYNYAELGKQLDVILTQDLAT